MKEKICAVALAIWGFYVAYQGILMNIGMIDINALLANTFLSFIPAASICALLGRE